MNWRWLLYDATDPEWELTSEQRAEIRDRVRARFDAEGRFFSRPQSIFGLLSLLLFFAILLSMGILADLIESTGVPLRRGLIEAIALLGPLAVGHVLLTYTWRRLTVGRTREVARELGIDLCAHCGYLLHGLNEMVQSCPECGADRQPFTPSPRES